MFHKPIQEWTGADLQSLITQQVAESKTIDYKRELPGGSERDKNELCADVSSFANASGGYLIFGIEETGGVPTTLTGLDLPDPDAEILRLESIIQSGVTPRIPGLSTARVNLADNKKAIIIYVRKSFIAPHAVTLGDPARTRLRFHSRTSAGKQALDYQEVKASFLLTEGIRERMRDFRLERISNIISGETPVALTPTPTVVFHVIPLMSFEAGIRFDVRDLVQRGVFAPPLGTTGFDDPRYNFDGVLTIDQRPTEPQAHAYTQLFNNGIVEGVNSRLYNTGNISGSFTEDKLFRFLRYSLQAQEALGVEPPFLLCLSFIGMKGLTMVGDYERAYPIDRENLIVPPVLVDSFDFDIPVKMKPLVDALWNAAGYPESQSYRTGTWRLPR